jgi:nitrous oxide reductase accessory protein NosL
MKKIIIAILAAVLLLAGCGTSHAATPPPTTTGGNFLPAYLGMLQGKQPFPHDNSCYSPGDLRQLLVPCDEGGTPSNEGK